MSSFTEALEYVHGALCELQNRGARLAASAEALRALAASAPVAAAAAPAPKFPSPSPLPPKPVSRTPGAPAAVPLLPKVTPVRGGSAKAQRLAEFREKVLSCTQCPELVKARSHVVFGVGSPDAELMFVGEAPGEDEDRQGEPFVGKAGQLLTKIIETMGYTREQVYIANVLKCRPDMPPGEPGDRKPRADEMKTCLPYLEQQIEIVQPKVLVALGATAMEGLLGSTEPMSHLRGRWHEFRGIPLMATYHPAYLLHNQSLSEKRKVWEDMLLVLEKLGLEISEKQRAYFLPKE